MGQAWSRVKYCDANRWWVFFFWVRCVSSSSIFPSSPARTVGLNRTALLTLLCFWFFFPSPTTSAWGDVLHPFMKLLGFIRFWGEAYCCEWLMCTHSLLRICFLCRGRSYCLAFLLVYRRRSLTIILLTLLALLSIFIRIFCEWGRFRLSFHYRSRKLHFLFVHSLHFLLSKSSECP